MSSGPSKPHSEPCEPAARLIVRKAGRPGGPGPVVVRLRVAEKQLGGVARSRGEPWAGFDPRHPRGILPAPIGHPRAPYGRLAGLLGRVPMLRASRRGDRKRVPQYSSLLLRGGRTGIFREASAGCRPGTRWASRPRSAVPEGPATPTAGKSR